MKCLVTKLQSVVSDNSLKKMDEIRIQVNSTGGGSLKILRRQSVEGELLISTPDGSEKVSLTNGSWKSSVSIPIPSNYEQETTIYVASGAYELSVIHKNAICGISSSDGQIFFIEPEDVSRCVNLVKYNIPNISEEFDIALLSGLNGAEEISFKGVNYVGNISELKVFPRRSLTIVNTSLVGDVAILSKMTTLQSINIEQNLGLEGDILTAISSMNDLYSVYAWKNNNLRGDLEKIKGLTKVTKLDLSKSGNITGDIKHLGRMSQLTYLAIVDTNCYGTIEEMVQSFVQNGRTSGSINMPSANYISKVTFNGIALRTWLANNLPGIAHAAVTWQGETITITKMPDIV